MSTATLTSVRLTAAARPAARPAVRPRRPPAPPAVRRPRRGRASC